MEQNAAGRAAETLFAEHKAGVLFKPLGPPDRPAGISDAYDIQDKYVALLRPEQGEPVGYKVGLTSKTMQAFCGIDHPIGGVVLARRVHPSGATVRRGDYGRLGLEFEVAVRVKSDIPATAQTPAAIAPSTRNPVAGRGAVRVNCSSLPSRSISFKRRPRSGSSGSGTNRCAASISTARTAKIQNRAGSASP